jgi:Txe/YoeB family toxin of Txe-Axe toxin-antitoxin module
MATVVWSKRAHCEKDRLYFNGIQEFGATVAKRTARKIKEIENDLSRWPKTGFPEPLLRDNIIFYRSRHINKRFKVVYWYDETKDTVVIEDIWDTLRSPENLTGRMKNEN